MEIKGKSDVTVNINGRKYTGNTVIIDNDCVYMDGQCMDNIKTSINGELNIQVYGQVDHMTLNNGKINADCVHHIETFSGDVKCRTVQSVNTCSGNIMANTISGSVRTVSGDVMFNNKHK